MTAKCPITGIGESQKITKYLRKIIRLKYGSGQQRRIFHAKTIGVVKASLTVPDLSSNKRLAVGIFRTAREYNDITIRFTKGNASIVPDGKTAIHGMAIKIRIPDNGNNKEKDDAVQDIILANNPVFYPYQLSGQYPSMKFLLAPQWIERAYYLVKVAVKDFFAALRFLRKRKNPANLFEEIYYSGTPYKFGENDKIKWSAWPSKVVCSVVPKPVDDEYFLTARMRSDLETDIPASGNTDTVVLQPRGPSEKNIDYRVTYTLCVQFQEDEDTEPIENCSVEWKTKFHPVGVIKIAAQQVEFIENKGIDHGLWYSPGNALAEHAPLGKVNEVRAQVYEKLATERLSVNDKKGPDSVLNHPQQSSTEIKIITGSKSRSEV